VPRSARAGLQPIAPRRRRRGDLPDHGAAPSSSTGSTTASATGPAIRTHSPRGGRRAKDHKIFLVWQTTYKTFEASARAARGPQRGSARVGHPGPRRRHEVLRARGRHRVPSRPVTRRDTCLARPPVE
jgi:hypothetical protein